MYVYLSLFLSKPRISIKSQSNEQALISLKQDEETRHRKEIQEKQYNKETWLDAAAERTKEKKQVRFVIIMHVDKEQTLPYVMLEYIH